MNPNIAALQPYPFERLGKLLNGIAQNHTPIVMTIGEPKHKPPQIALDALTQSVSTLNIYPTTKGEDYLRETIAQWLKRRFHLMKMDANSQVIPVNGTREALFSVAQALFEKTRPGLILMPNPFYQIYEGAALLAGGEPHFLPSSAESGFVPDYSAISDDVWQRTQMLYLCSPGNPSGAVTDKQTLAFLIEKSQAFGFTLLSDECYSELYADEKNPPPGLLQVAAEMGLDDYSGCLVFHSLSKRSNVPGLRSGFVAGDAKLIAPYLQYRTYHGCALPVHHQMVSHVLWQDEEHVRINRQAYRHKFALAKEILQDLPQMRIPEASFYLWLKTPGCDQAFAQSLWQEEGVKVLPGSFLSRQVDGINPGSGYVRIALVAETAEVTEGLERIQRHYSRML